MVSEFKINEIKNWINRSIVNVEDLINEKENDGEDVRYLDGVLYGLKMCQENLFDGGIYDLEK